MRYTEKRTAAFSLQKHHMISAAVTGVFAALLIVCGCGGDRTDSVLPYEEEQGKVYAAEYYVASQKINDIALSGDRVYYCTEAGECYRWTPGRDAERLISLTEEGWSCTRVAADDQENLYLIGSAFSRDKDNGIASFLFKFDNTGRELFRQDISKLFPYGVRALAVDSQKHIYIQSDKEIFLFDADGSYAKAVSVPDWKDTGRIAADEQGQIYCSLNDYAHIGGDEICGLSFAEAELTSIFRGFSSGSGFFAAPGGKFLTSGNGRLYVYDSGSAAQEEMLAWMNVGIEPDAVNESFGMLADGRIVVLLNESGRQQEFAVLAETDRESVSERKTLTLGTVTAGSTLRRFAAQYNRLHEDSRIRIKEYYDYALDVDGSGKDKARADLNLDIVSGNCPDILNLEYEDLENYASKGLFIDLEPLLEENNLRILPNVKEAYTFGGIVAALPNTVQVRTLAGISAGLPSGETWNIEEMLSFMEQQSPEKVLRAEPQDMLEYSMIFNQSRFVDWKNYSCSFDSEDFLQVLEYCGRFKTGTAKPPSNIMGLLTSAPDMEQKPNLVEVTIRTAEDIALLEQLFDGREFRFIGFPAAEGSGHLLEAADGAYAVTSSARHPQEAMEFIRLLLTDVPDTQSFAALLNGTGFPVEENAREQYFQAALQQSAEGDSLRNGRAYVSSLTAYGVRYYFYIPLQEELDRLEELIASAGTDKNARGELLSIIQEEAAVYFNGQKSAGEAADIIQNRASIYLKEQK